jgi:hypothetical protein
MYLHQNQVIPRQLHHNRVIPSPMELYILPVQITAT